MSFNGASFGFGGANVSNVLSATGQTITLPAGNFLSLRMLAAGVNGNQASQSFIVHFSDGTSSTFTQSLSDSFIPQNFTGESVASALDTSQRIPITANTRGPKAPIYACSRMRKPSG